jgi:hypothetical protein
MNEPIRAGMVVLCRLFRWSHRRHICLSGTLQQCSFGFNTLFGGRIRSGIPPMILPTRSHCSWNTRAAKSLHTTG